jgi:hypothetical protein
MGGRGTSFIQLQLNFGLAPTWIHTSVIEFDGNDLGNKDLHL